MAFAVLFVLCLVCAIMAGVIRSRDMQNSASLLFTAQSGTPGYVGFLNFWSSLIIFQNIIPISLYVSIEFVKTFQVRTLACSSLILIITPPLGVFYLE